VLFKRKYNQFILPAADIRIIIPAIVVVVVDVVEAVAAVAQNMSFFISICPSFLREEDSSGSSFFLSFFLFKFRIYSGFSGLSVSSTDCSGFFLVWQ